MRRTNAPERFLNALTWTPNENWDAVFVGLPYSGGSLSGGRSSFGPSWLRSVSRIISPQPLTDRSEGWWDHREQRLLCPGLRIADAGDLTVDPLHAAEDLDRLPPVLRALRETCSLLVILGGDDSLSYWTHRDVDGVVVHLDAHEDAVPVLEGRGPHHANFVSHLELHSPAHIVQYGLRGLSPGQPRPRGDRRVLASDPQHLRELLAASPAGDCAVTLDVDILEPELMRSVTAPVPDGLTADAVLEALAAAAEPGRLIRQFSVMEFAPDPSSGRLDAMRLVHLIMRALDMWLGTDSND